MKDNSFSLYCHGEGYITYLSDERFVTDNFGNPQFVEFSDIPSYFQSADVHDEFDDRNAFSRWANSQGWATYKE